MGFRFRKSIRLFPGVRLNLSKTGVSASVGRPGATINIGRRGVRGTVGVPGSGLSYSEMLTGGEGRAEVDPATAGKGIGCILFAIVGLLIAAVATCSSMPDSVPERIQPVPPAARPLFVTADSLNCRAAPTADAAVIGKRERGEAVTLVARQADWIQVESSGGVCWMAKRHLSFDSPGLARAPAPPSPGPRPLAPTKPPPQAAIAGGCSCASRAVCTGPRGGRYCLTSGGTKRYGV